MTINKLLNATDVHTLQQKTNEVIDAVNNGGGGGGSSSRNIGEIVFSTTPLIDAGLHLLDGALINGSGIYSGFVTRIAGLITDYPERFTTEANWQTAVTTYGVCGKFVYDSVNNTVRLPKYSNKIYSSSISSTAPVVGNGMTVGFTDGTHNTALAGRLSGGVQSYAGTVDSMYGSTTGTAGTGSWANSAPFYSLGITTDATKSGIIADLANITTSLDGYYYIVIATSTKTDIQVDIDEIATDLSGKADVNLSNAVPAQAYKNVSMGWLIPDYSQGISISSGYVCPSVGFVDFSDWHSSGNCYIAVNGNNVWWSASGGGHITVSYQGYVSQGDVITYDLYNVWGADTIHKFYPLKGVN